MRGYLKSLIQVPTVYKMVRNLVKMIASVLESPNSGTDAVFNYRFGMSTDFSLWPLRCSEK